MLNERLVSEIETLKFDLNVTSQKLNSKSQAVTILHEALQQCQKERDEFKRMAEQLTSLLVESLEANKALEQELVRLKSELSDVTGDMKLLRKQLKDRSPTHQTTNEQKPSIGEKQLMVTHMEKLSDQINELQHELARCMDETAELSTERDIYRNKCDRLNNELNYILNGDERKIVDIDVLIMEKKSLKCQLQTVEEEKRLAMATLSKYQKLMERKVSKSSSAGSDCAFTPGHSPKHQVDKLPANDPNGRNHGSCSSSDAFRSLSTESANTSPGAPEAAVLPIKSSNGDSIPQVLIGS